MRPGFCRCIEWLNQVSGLAQGGWNYRPEPERNAYQVESFGGIIAFIFLHKHNWFCLVFFLALFLLFKFSLFLFLSLSLSHTLSLTLSLLTLTK